MSLNSCLNENLKPDVVGGYNLTAIRAIFDQDDTNVIVPSTRQLFYYNVESCGEVGRASISSRLGANESIVACERLDLLLYIFTNNGRVFVWSLDTRDWINELYLPLSDSESLISCKLLSKRQYVYSILDCESKVITLNYSMSKSERERPKQKQPINEVSSGTQNAFDIGCLTLQVEHSSSPDKGAGGGNDKQRCLTYISGSRVYFQQVVIGRKMTPTSYKQIINETFTCVRANDKRPMVAAGDSIGRIYLYTGEFAEDNFIRTKLHWHSLPVNDLCYSSTGNTLFSVGGESGCVVIWDLTQNNIGQKRVIARLGMPIRHINCANILNQLVLSFEDNEIRFMDTSDRTRHLRTFTRRAIDMYKKNDHKALRLENIDSTSNSVGLLWDSKTDTVVTNGRVGHLQFYSPKSKVRLHAINFLKENSLTLETDGKVIPSDITRAAITLDGQWIAFYETRESSDLFPTVELHIWQQSTVTNRWTWIQTAEKLHSSTSISDLKFSPDGQFLISVCEDGTFQVLHRICFDVKAWEDGPRANSKLMYAKGFCGTVPSGLPAMATFSQDSSVMAMSLKNDTTLVWMIVDPYKLVYECQMSQVESESEVLEDSQETSNSKSSGKVLGLHFGYHKPSQSLAPLCEIRSNSIRIWNILNAQETMEYASKDTLLEGVCQDESFVPEFTAAAFDQCPGDSRSLDHFAVITNKNLLLIFKLQINPASKHLTPLIVVDCILSHHADLTYSHMCFVGNPIMNIDSNCHQDPEIVKLLNRLCLMNSHQELVSITDKLTLERQLSSNNCNGIKTYEMSELQAYLAKSLSDYRKEKQDLPKNDKLNPEKMTEKQKQIRKRLEVQKMLKDLLIRIPSQNLPQMSTLGPMILDKLI